MPHAKACFALGRRGPPPLCPGHSHGGDGDARTRGVIAGCPARVAGRRDPRRHRARPIGPGRPRASHSRPEAPGTRSGVRPRRRRRSGSSGLARPTRRPRSRAPSRSYDSPVTAHALRGPPTSHRVSDAGLFLMATLQTNARRGSQSEDAAPQLHHKRRSPRISEG